MFDLKNSVGLLVGFKNQGDLVRLVEENGHKFSVTVDSFPKTDNLFTVSLSYYDPEFGTRSNYSNGIFIFDRHFNDPARSMLRDLREAKLIPGENCPPGCRLLETYFKLNPAGNLTDFDAQYTKLFGETYGRTKRA